MPTSLTKRVRFGLAAGVLTGAVALGAVVPSQAQAAVAPRTAVSSSVLAQAAAASGGFYVHGGTSPRGFDCSGFTQYVFRKVGVNLPRTAAAQAAATHRIPASAARPGDLVFWSNGRSVYHVAIYAGAGKVYQASHPGKRTGLGVLYGKNYFFGRA